MGRYRAVITVDLDTQRDGRRAAEFVVEDTVRCAKGWLAARRVEWTLKESDDAQPADPAGPPAQGTRGVSA